VLGLTEWRGRLLTVLDLPYLLEDEGTDAPPCVVRLASPLRHTALVIRAVVRVDVSDSRERSPAAAGASGVSPTLIDPAALVARLEAEILSPPHAGAARTPADPPAAAEG